MSINSSFKPLDLGINFLENINRRADFNFEEAKHNAYQNRVIDPPFRYYNDDTNLNLTSKVMPNYDMTYKNKSMFGREKPIQTEHDEIGVNQPFLNNYYGYTDYGNFNVANQSLPESWKHKTTPKNNLFELV